jgi:crotonobetainyl-CoA:carnitine CoA-transferase CaiB-like acyl-CoA transferase
MQPLDNLRVLDFTTLLPGPMATLILAEAGAEVIKIERPGGEEMRARPPRHGDTSVLFAILNRGKKSLEIDLKEPGAVALLRPLIESADVLVEQFRPGVMERLGLGYEAVRAINPRLVYCSITGYGQSGPKVAEAGHDLNYAADTGLLSMTRGADGAPVIPHTQIADIGAGTYPAVMNIVIALWRRERCGEGCHLDISMTDNLFPFLWMPLALGHATGQWAQGGDLPLTGASPRYQIYATADGAWVAVGALEQKFWDAFCEAIGLAAELREDTRDPTATIAAVAEIVASSDAEHWRARFAGKDVCSVVMKSLEEAVRDPHFTRRGVFAHSLAAGDLTLPAMPVPLAPSLRGADEIRSCPALGSADALVVEPRASGAGGRGKGT